jgi:hypothetical protein
MYIVSIVSKKSCSYKFYGPAEAPLPNVMEIDMAKKKGKSVSFDALIKFFMHNYNIPTKRDIEILLMRLDRIERLVVASAENRGRRGAENRGAGRIGAATASDTVMEIVQRFPQGIGFADIKLNTGFDEKKLRNILFRLNKLGKIKRKRRGVYQPSA